VTAVAAKDGERDLFSRLVDPFCPPDVHQVEEELRRQYRAVVTFIYVGATVIFGFANLNLKHHNYVAAGVQYITVAVVLAMLLVNRRGYPKISAHVCVCMTTVTIFIGMWTGGGMSAAAIVFLPMIPPVGLLSVGQGGGVSGAIQAICLIITVAVLEKLGFQPRYDPPDKLFIKRLAESIAVVMEIWAICYLFFRLKNEAFALLSSKRDELAGLFDSMRQGVLAFGADGRITGQYSPKARRIFSASTLDEARVDDLLYPNSPPFDLGRQEFVTWLESVFMADPDELAEMMAFAPQQCVRYEAEPNEQHLSLEFRPILESGRLVRVMLLVSDETEQVLAKRAAEAERAAGERALERMRRLAAGGAHAFLDMLRGVDARLAEIARTFSESDDALSVGETDLAFRLAHTIKGDARLYDLDRLGQLAEQLEDQLTELRARLLSGASVSRRECAQQIVARLSDASVAVDVARAGLVDASPIGAAILDQVTVREADLRALRQQVMRMHMTLGEEATPLSELTSRLLARPFGESAAGLIDAVERWSAQQGKRALARLSGKEISVTPDLHEILPGVLGHLVRNAVAHGIEAPDDRLRRGKPERGVINIQCESTASGPCISIADDGAGIDVERLKQRALSLGITWGDNDPLELMFVDGLSTAPEVDAISGRGVGMSAVRADLAKVGYVIEARSEPTRGTSFVLRPARMHGTPKAA
jgi:HPt (histidine-containing phosphotransfer) domain-containing protein